MSRPNVSWRAAGVALVCAIAVGAYQPRLATRLHAVNAREDVYVLPPPGVLKAATLGWRAAAADMLWAQLLVEYGIHWAEKRPFPDLEKYLDAILILEPDHKLLYQFVDTLLVYRPPQGYEADARSARRYLERGIKERPHDHEVWLNYGQFTAFLAPAWLASEAERDQWRRDGAQALLHAVELGADPHNTLSVTGTLKRFGERDAAIRQLRRAYALAEDPDTRERIAAQLGGLEAAEQREEAEKDARFIESRWRRDYPFLSRAAYLQLGPEIDPAACAGLDGAAKPECTPDWTAQLPSSRK